jgi:hypothetical protein
MKQYILRKKIRRGGEFCYEVIDRETGSVECQRNSRRDYVAAFVYEYRNGEGKPIYRKADNFFGKLSLVTKPGQKGYREPDGIALIETVQTEFGERVLMRDIKRGGGPNTVGDAVFWYELPAEFRRVELTLVNEPFQRPADWPALPVPEQITDEEFKAIHEPADDFEPATDADGFAPDQFAAGDAIANDAELKAAQKETDPPAATPDPAPEALIGRVSLDDWQLDLISDQINQRIGNLAGITNLIIEHDDAPAAGDMDLLVHLSKAVDSLEQINAIVRAERDARFSYLVEVAKENAIDAEKEPIFCNSKSKEQLDGIIFNVGACLTRPGGVFATIADRDPQKYVSTVQDDGQVLIWFVYAMNEKQIQRIAAKPYGVEFARAMFSESLPLRVKEEIRRRSGRVWPRFDDSGQPIGQVHPDEFRKAAEEMFDSDFGGFKF